MTGYQQSILYLVGSQLGDRFTVRNVDRHYIEAVEDVFVGYTPYLQKNSPGKRDYWVLKSPLVKKPTLSEVSDEQGFARGFIELQGTLASWTHRGRARLRLRIYGSEDDLQFLQRCLPAKEKKIQHVNTENGSTCALYYQSGAEIFDIFRYIDGEPRNDRLWTQWEAELISHLV